MLFKYKNIKNHCFHDFVLKCFKNFNFVTLGTVTKNMYFYLTILFIFQSKLKIFTKIMC